MRKHLRTATLLLAMLPLIATTASNAQTGNIRFETFIAPVETFRTLTVQQITSALLFSLTLRNDSDQAENVRLYFSISRGSTSIVEAQTRFFVLSPGMPRSITNLTILRGLGDDIRKDFVRINDDEVTGILTSGKLPNGRYVGIIRVESQAGQIFDEQRFEILIRNITTLDLVYPGQAFGFGECPILYDPRPRLIWNSNADRFRLIVCKKTPENPTPDRILNCPPLPSMTPINIIVERGVHFDYARAGVPIVSLNDLFALPEVKVTQLDPNETYFWQVIPLQESEGMEAAASGNPSPVWCFTVADPADMSELARRKQILDALGALLGFNVYERFPQLEGHNPTTIRYDGRTLEPGELIDLLSGNEIKSVELVE